MILRNEFPPVIDSSIRSAFVTCPEKFQRQYIQSLHPAGESTHLIAGGAFAKGLEVVRLAYWRDGKPFAEAMELGLIAATAAYGNHEPSLKLQTKSLNRVLGAMDFYFTKWPIETDNIRPYWWDEGKPAVEFRFAIPLPIAHPVSGEPLIYGGRADLIGVFQNTPYVVDEKTTSQLGPTWGDKWNLRGQFTGYTWASRESGIPVKGAIVRGISFLKNDYGHAESIQSRPQFMIDRWYNQLLRDVQRMVDAWNAGHFDMVFDEACAGFGACPFHSLCSSAQPDDWIEGKFEERVWNPLHKED